MEELLFRSTNRNSPLASFKEVLLRGQAEDYGLYMPVSIPVFSRKTIESFGGMDYCRISCEVMGPFLAGSMGSDIMEGIVKKAFDFAVPIQTVDENLYILWLTKGPTASFKDFAARFLAGTMGFFASGEKKRLTVITATSGDTGGAVAKAFYGIDNISVAILFPEEEVTGRQRKQMTSLGGNIMAFAVKGKFDDCQAIAKKAFKDNSLKSFNLTSANSINFGRLLPQAVYYFYAYSRLGHDEINFSVPSGNFGNLTAGLLAAKMGLPVKRFIAGVNGNDEFPRFLNTGTYNPVVPSVQCSSNAMNVGHPSNLARIVDIYGGWMSDERDASGEVIKKGLIKSMPDMESMRRDIVSCSVSEKEVDGTIREFWEKYGIIIEPHGAVAAASALTYSGDTPTVFMETADPAKFPESIRRVLGFEPEIPESLSRIDEEKEDFIPIENSYEDFRRNLLKKIQS